MLRWALPPFFDMHAAGGLMALNGEITRQGTMISYDAIFSGLAVLTLLMAPPLLFLKPPPPMPAQQIREEALAAD